MSPQKSQQSSTASMANPWAQEIFVSDLWLAHRSCAKCLASPHVSRRPGPQGVRMAFAADRQVLLSMDPCNFGRGFDLGAFVMLGEPGVGQSPLRRSVLMAQCRVNKNISIMMTSHASGAFRKSISCEGSLGQSSWATFWMILARRR